MSVARIIWIKIIILLALFVFSAEGYSQERIKKPQSIEKRKKDLSKIKDNQKAEGEASRKSGMASHLSIQDKKTKKRIKKNMKSANKKTRKKSVFQLSRIFGK